VGRKWEAINREPRNTNHIQGDIRQGERAFDREALLAKGRMA